MTAELGFRISSDASFLLLHNLQAVSGDHSASRPYLGLIQPRGRIWDPYRIQAVSGAHTASRPYLGLVQPPGRIRGLFSLQAVSGAHSTSRPYLGPIQPRIQCLPGDLFPGGKGVEVWSWKNHLNWVPKLRIDGALSLLPHASSWLHV
jgi:hypothetical protein